MRIKPARNIFPFFFDKSMNSNLLRLSYQTVRFVGIFNRSIVQTVMIQSISNRLIPENQMIF
jgi:hypothetical protein